MSDLAADMYKQQSYLVDTSDMMLQKAALGTKEEIKLQQLLLLPLSCSGPHNDVLVSFVSLDTLNMPVSAATANKVARYGKSSERRTESI